MLQTGSGEMGGGVKFYYYKSVCVWEGGSLAMLKWGGAQKVLGRFNTGA